eukprot:gene6632-13437_t
MAFFFNIAPSCPHPSKIGLGISTCDIAFSSIHPIRKIHRCNKKVYIEVQEDILKIDVHVRDRSVSNGIFKLLVLFIGAVVYSVVTGNIFSLLLPLLWIAYFIKNILFELLLLENIIESNMGLRDWYNRVDDGLYLGGLPMESMDHKSVLALDLKIEAVLSILEDFEYRTGTLAGRAVQPEDWKREDMAHSQLVSKDFYPPSFEVLEQGADWINMQLIQNKKVYCHCKSGIGRSASVIIAYFIKYKRMSAEAAYNDLRSHRSVIFSKSSSQMKNILAYETHKNLKFSSK